ncbi:MAG: deoxyguanosinetriphosphate triphosphohydrolase [Ornithinimicrobium sp.]
MANESRVVPGYEPADRERWLPEDPAIKRADRDDFARDRARVVHSAGLRRLALTTQVVQPGSDDFVRNRLTHSLEVAQIGREFGAALGCAADVVDAACLAHDLGHPPFGHHGESVLAELARDIGGFEGNAQTLRVLTRLEAKRVHPDGRSAGLNLTRATLDAVVKYPWAHGEVAGTGKFGFYPDDAEVYHWVRPSATAAPPSHPSRTPQQSRAVDHRRCLEAQVMDWADDVAYCVHDIEDGVTSRRIDLRALRSPTEAAAVVAIAQLWYAPDIERSTLAEALDRLLTSGWIPGDHDGSRASLAALKDMTSRLIGHFVHTVEDATRERHGRGRLTRYGAGLVVPERIRAEASVLKGAAAHFVMMSDERRDVMHRQREIVTSLFSAYTEHPHRLDPMHAAAHAEAVEAGDEAAATRSIIDQVASLSDTRAHALFGAWR